MMKMKLDARRATSTAAVVGAILLTATAVAALGRPRPEAGEPATVEVRLSEWRVELSRAAVPAGPVTFHVRNGGTVPHALEVEGRGVERETAVLQPGTDGSLTLTLRPGRYEVYCPVGGDSHKRLGMVASLTVTAAGAAQPASMQAPRAGAGASAQAAVRRIRVTGGGPVIQVLPGPFPFADSAAAVIRARPDDQQRELAAKAAHGAYSNQVAPISGRFSFTAVERGAAGDSVDGVAEVRASDGAHWRVVMDRAQTRDIPFNPRFGGVIMGLYYHGASGVHTPLVPTINSAVALWAYAHLYRDDALVTDSAMVHVMLLSRTRRPGDFHLACWDCSRNPVEELQLQVTAPPGHPPLEAPGGFLFVNWERSTYR
jgi:uncharacterized cupredoxin-like copper-binding protein